MSRKNGIHPCTVLYTAQQTRRILGGDSEDMDVKGFLMLVVLELAVQTLYSYLYSTSQSQWISSDCPRYVG